MTTTEVNYIMTISERGVLVTNDQSSFVVADVPRDDADHRCIEEPPWLDQHVGRKVARDILFHHFARWRGSAFASRWAQQFQHRFWNDVLSVVANRKEVISSSLINTWLVLDLLEWCDEAPPCWLSKRLMQPCDN